MTLVGDTQNQGDDYTFLVDRLRKRDVKTLAKALFNHDLAPGQCQIVESILYPDDRNRRVTISAYTRYGKTFAAGDGVSMRLLFQEEAMDVKLIAPTGDQASILRGYIADNIIHQKLLADQLDLDVTGIQKLKKEISKTRFTFKNGHELALFTADGKADRLMGWGGDLILLDESCLIPKDVYDAKISRMLGDDPERSALVELLNPWHKESHSYLHWQDPAWRKVHIPWQQGVLERRTTVKFVEEQRSQLAPTHFQVLYDSTFPDQAEDQLIPWSHIQRANRRKPWAALQDTDWLTLHGLDVADGGGDATVLTRTHRRMVDGKQHAVMEWQKSRFVGNTVETAGWSSVEAGDGATFVVDENGVGKGVADELRTNLHRKVHSFKGGREASHKDRFVNLTSEVLWNLRVMLEEGRLILLEPAPQLLTDLTQWRWETAQGRIKVTRGGTKSPDFGDSLAFSCWGQVGVAGPQVLKRRDPLM